MKYFSVSIIAFLICNFFAYGQENDSSLIFTQDVEWNSFKGIPDNDTLAARISTKINLEVVKVSIWNGKIQFKAYASMNPYESWVKPGYKDLYTLQHEQTHFDITEIHARQLQSDLNLMKIKSQKSPAIQAAILKWDKKLEAMQKQYDEETKGGNDQAIQKIWNEKIFSIINGSD
jgi:hypothetical protein